MRGKLAACAFALFSERGMDRVTMDDVAASAGVTKGSLYWHYRSKNDTIHAACRFYYDSWRDQMERELSGLSSARGPRKSGEIVRAHLPDRRAEPHVYP